MIRTILAATLIAGATFTTAFAADGPRLIGTGDNAQMTTDTPRVVLGGGEAQLSGSDNNAAIVYRGTGSGLHSPAGDNELARVGNSAGKGA